MEKYTYRHHWFDNDELGKHKLYYIVVVLHSVRRRGALVFFPAHLISHTWSVDLTIDARKNLLLSQGQPFCIALSGEAKEGPTKLELPEEYWVQRSRGGSQKFLSFPGAQISQHKYGYKKYTRDSDDIRQGHCTHCGFCSP